MAKEISQAAGLLGARVREHRNTLGLSQEALAYKSGIHWTFLGQVERGQRNLSLHNIIKIAGGLDVDPAVLVAGIPASAVPHEDHAQSPAERIRIERQAGASQ